MQFFVPTFRATFTAVCLLAFAALAQAQWGWKGSDGRMVFSDQPPPQGVAEKDITRRPAGSRAAATSSAVASNNPTATNSTPSTTASSTATAPKLSGKDAELDKRKKEAEAKEAADKKAEDAKFAAAKRDNCERAKRSKANFDSGVRISTNNAKGEREVMGEAQRAEETKRLQGIIAADCS